MWAAATLVSKDEETDVISTEAGHEEGFTITVVGFLGTLGNGMFPGAVVIIAWVMGLSGCDLIARRLGTSGT